MKLFRHVKLGKLTISVMFVALTLYLVFFFSFIYPFSFNYEIEINDHYYLACTWPVAGVIILLYGIVNRFVFSVVQVLFLLFLVYISFLIYFSKYYHWGNEHFTVVTSVMLSVGLILFVKEIRIVYFLFFLFSLLLVYELYTGYQQYIGLKDYTTNISLEIRGSFQNSGVFAIYLVTQLPILYFVSWDLKMPLAVKNKYQKKLFIRWIRKAAFLLLLLLTIFLIYKTQSRTAYISSLAAAIGWFLIKRGESFKNQLKKITVFWLALITVTAVGILAVAGYYLFVMKKMSALGRMMKIEITCEHIMDHFWLGTGLGRFTWYYPQWQAEYFATNPHPSKSYFLSAGESYIIFNEPLQLLKEAGLIGFIIFILLLIYFFRSRSEKNKALLHIAKLTMVTILACSFTSYPLHVNLLLMQMGLCFAIAVYCRQETYYSHIKPNTIMPKWLCTIKPFSKIAFIAVIIIIIGFTSYKGLSELKSVRQWQLMQNDPGQQRDLQQQYKTLYTSLKYNGKFLTGYGIWLGTDSARCKQAIDILQQARQYFISSVTIEAATEAFACAGNYPRAIEDCQWLSDYMPNKFLNKYELLKLYQTMKDTSRVKQIAHFILNMPVKIPSPEIDGIKKKVIRLLYKAGRE